MMDGRGNEMLSAGFDEAQWLAKVPSGVCEVIGKRLNRLSVSAVRLLSIAACIGRNFDLGLLAGLEADKSEDDILLALEEALTAHLIEPVPQTEGFRFGHALIRETLYDEMLALRRSRLHWRIGQLLEQRLGVDDVADAELLPQLAYHFIAAGAAAADKAMVFAKRAAEQAAAQLAYEEAIRLYGLALKLQQLHQAKDAALHCELLLALGAVQIDLGVIGAGHITYQQAAELARQHGLSGAFVNAAIGVERGNTNTGASGERAVALLLEAIELHRNEDPLHIELLARLCRAYVYCDQRKEALAAREEAKSLARKLGDRRGLFLAVSSIASAVFGPSCWLNGWRQGMRPGTSVKS